MFETSKVNYFILQYPKWLEDNKDNKDVAADMNNYRKQHELIAIIIKEFDSEKESDTDEEKSKRFEKIMDHMQQVGIMLTTAPRLKRCFTDFQENFALR